ncbi:signal peptidase I [Calidifontibacillus erzurumensis]|uniref:Signal peptidase I n=1 Tax=Calidifontibacillus erzurumensis TaxID=2741433 RepID=A0A8J8KBM4_9BACI|nr:signal peptidase I [Calidifontibacillus erzurumensis]NSL51203.1 signal peptidase I [Calidifontibacillus erzurumensis]
MSQKNNEVWEWIKALIIAVLLAGGIRLFLFAPIVVDGESMMPTLEDHYRMIVNKIGYKIGEPERFDIIVFHATEDRDYIKRVIGLPGEHVAYKDDVLYINGKPVEEPFLEEAKKKADGPLTYDFTLEEVTGLDRVPEGHLFVLGDNRRFSKDSRIIGTISMDQVLGKTNIVYWPPSDFKIIK